MLRLLRLKVWIEMAVARRPVEEVRPHLAAHIPALTRILDLDDLGTEVGQEHGAERPGPILLDRQDPHAREWQHRLRSGAAR